MIKSAAHKYIIGISAILALALAGGAGFKWTAFLTPAADVLKQIF